MRSLIENFERMQGFLVTSVFLIMFTIIVCVGMITGSPLMNEIINMLSGIIGTIAAFWFATRGQSQCNK